MNPFDDMAMDGGSSCHLVITARSWPIRALGHLGGVWSPAGVSPVFTAIQTRIQEVLMWWYFGLALAVIVAVAYILSRPSRRTTIVLERD